MSAALRAPHREGDSYATPSGGRRWIKHSRTRGKSDAADSAHGGRRLLLGRRGLLAAAQDELAHLRDGDDGQSDSDAEEPLLEREAGRVEEALEEAELRAEDDGGDRETARQHELAVLEGLEAEDRAPLVAAGEGE